MHSLDVYIFAGIVDTYFHSHTSAKTPYIYRYRLCYVHFIITRANSWKWLKVSLYTFMFAHLILSDAHIDIGSTLKTVSFFDLSFGEGLACPGRLTM